MILDAGVLNVALPTIAAEFSVSIAATQWVITAYTLALAALLLPAGALVDRQGVRTLVLAGTALFTAASAACVAATSVQVLIAARVVQGIGAATLLPATLAAIPLIFPAGRPRERATTAWVATGAVAMAGAPFLGGLLMQLIDWRAVFFVNVPIGIAACIVGARTMPRQTNPPRVTAWLGQALVALAMFASTAAVALSAEPRSVGFAGAIVLAVAAGAGFVWHERTARVRIIPSGFFADSARRTATSSAGLMGFVFYATLLYLSLWFQQHGMNPLSAGVALLPLTVASIAGPLFAYRKLAVRWGAARVLAGGFAVVLVGALTLASSMAQPPYLLIAVAMVLIGGLSTVCFSALTSILIAATPVEQAGIASGIQNTTRQAAAAIAVAAVATTMSTTGGHRTVVVGAIAITALLAFGLALRHTIRDSDIRLTTPRNDP